MDLVRHFPLRLPPIPVQISDLSICLQQNPNRSTKAHRKASCGWDVPAQGLSSLSAVHPGRDADRSTQPPRSCWGRDAAPPGPLLNTACKAWSAR